MILNQSKMEVLYLIWALKCIIYTLFELKNFGFLCVEVTLHSARILPGSIIVESIHARAFGVPTFILPNAAGQYELCYILCTWGSHAILEYVYWNTDIGILILEY